ncbi:MAG: serine/threonine protein kinase [Myxococcales bacterium]|nr:serine/threonine protein kinase [Myxococcales bacterium]
MSALEPGTMLGAYRIERFLGSGSMGEVFEALDTGLARVVAVKMLSTRHRDNAELRARFLREGRAVAAIAHPHVVSVFATGMHGDLPYIAMELLAGVDLGTHVERHGPLSASAAAAATRDAAMGLAAASAAGIIHRDVKPSNLVRLHNGSIKVTDFGLAKPKDPGREPALTGMGVVVGTPDYIAPEQARGEPLDERCDIYALGGTLFFLLTGRPPFRTGVASEDKYLKVVARHLRDPAPDPRQYRPDVPADLAALCRQLMAKDPAERPRYDELIATLDAMATRYAAASPTATPPAPVTKAPVAMAASTENLRQPAPATSGDWSEAADSLYVAAPRWPRWIWPLTVFSVAVFVSGLWAYASRPAHAPIDELASSRTIITVGGKQVAVEVAPVTTAAYRAVVADAPAAPDEQPVTNISYTQARAFAEASGKRLATRDELAAAADKIAAPPGMLWEWVASEAPRRTIIRGLTSKEVPDDPRPDVTFRLAQDVSAAAKP